MELAEGNKDGFLLSTAALWIDRNDTNENSQTSEYVTLPRICLECPEISVEIVLQNSNNYPAKSFTGLKICGCHEEVVKWMFYKQVASVNKSFRLIKIRKTEEDDQLNHYFQVVNMPSGRTN